MNLSLLPHLINIPRLQFLPRPWRFAEEFQAGFDAGVVQEALDGDLFEHAFPSEELFEFGEDAFERDAVQGVVFLFVGKRFHDSPVKKDL